MHYRGIVIVLCAAAVLLMALTAGFAYLTRMPGKKAGSTLAPLSAMEAETAGRLRNRVDILANRIGGRDARNYDNLLRAASYIETQLRQYGYETARQAFEADGLTFYNIEAQLTGARDPGSVVIAGAHYDTAGGYPGANDNASGVAATLELAQRFAGQPQTRSIRWVFFANEEPPYFQGPAMGSLVYARRSRQRGENIVAMMSLETIGYYSDEKGSQRYPPGLSTALPDYGNFLGFVADVPSAMLLRRVVASFRSATSLPSEGAAAPSAIPGVGWSDHWSFWQQGYRALMVTDTAPYRYPWYHTISDTPEKLDYERMARAITGLSAVIRDLGSR